MPERLNESFYYQKFRFYNTLSHLEALEKEYESFWSAHFETLQHSRFLSARRRNFQAKLSFLVALEQLEVFQEELENSINGYLAISKNQKKGSDHYPMKYKMLRKILNHKDEIRKPSTRNSSNFHLREIFFIKS